LGVGGTRITLDGSVDIRGDALPELETHSAEHFRWRKSAISGCGELAKGSGVILPDSEPIEKAESKATLSRGVLLFGRSAVAICRCRWRLGCSDRIFQTVAVIELPFWISLRR
jgi:hypothetical protein